MNKIILEPMTLTTAGDLVGGTIVQLKWSHFNEDVQDHTRPESDIYMITSDAQRIDMTWYVSVINLMTGDMYYIESLAPIDAMFDSEISLKEVKQ